MKMFSKISGLLFIVLMSLFIISCKEDSNDDPVPAAGEIPDETSFLVVNALSDNAGSVSFKLDGSDVALLGATAFSKYILTGEGTHTFKYNVGETAHEFSVVFEKDKRYTLLVYGTLDNPSVKLVKDSLPAVSANTKFAFRYINLYKGVDSISLQYYYPSYGMWATTAGSHEYIKFAEADAFAEYTAGVEVDWRVVKSNSETSQQVVSGTTYKIGSANVLYTPSNKLKGQNEKYHTYIIWAAGESKNNILITHEEQL